MYANGYVIDWKPATSDFSIWQFDAQAESPLSYPARRHGNWASLGIGTTHQLSVMGEYVLDWEPETNNYRLWNFDVENENVLTGPLRQGVLPAAIIKSSTFTAIETLIPVDAEVAGQPGSMDFMRNKIEHVIYYMVENRSFDHVCGWLYDKKAPIKVIGPEGPYRGVDPDFTNFYRGALYPVTKYNDGKLSETTPTESRLCLTSTNRIPITIVPTCCGRCSQKTSTITTRKRRRTWVALHGITVPQK